MPKSVFISHKNHINHHISVENRENIYLIDLRFIIQEYISTSKTAVRQMAGILSRPNPSAEVIGSPKRMETIRAIRSLKRTNPN